MAKRGSFFSDSFGLFKQTFSEWLEDKAPQLGAALAYYTVFSLALLILVLLAIVGLIFRSDPGGAWNKITEQMSYFLDKSAVEVVQNIAQKAAEPNKSLLAMIIGIGLSCRLHCLTLQRSTRGKFHRHVLASWRDPYPAQSNAYRSNLEMLLITIEPRWPQR
jgi:uncharacterized BrkB/YihY/UPF0761 family membrane protein